MLFLESALCCLWWWWHLLMSRRSALFSAVADLFEGRRDSSSSYSSIYEYSPSHSSPPLHPIFSHRGASPHKVAPQPKKIAATIRVTALSNAFTTRARPLFRAPTLINYRTMAASVNHNAPAGAVVVMEKVGILVTLIRKRH